MGEKADDMRSQDPQHIQSDIERTREDMGETVDEIQERLSPGHIQKEATERVRSATIGRVERAEESARETGTTMWETLKQNPLPAALVGVGLGWLYMSSSGSKQGGTQQARTSSGHSSGGTGGTTDRAMHQAQEMSSQMREQTEQMGDTAQKRVQSMRGQFSQVFQENPLGLGAFALGLGTAVGLAIPESPQEQQLMGERRDQLVSHAKGTAQEKMERAEDVAERTVDEAKKTAQDEARKQDLTE